jgi:hypothetical protein
MRTLIIAAAVASATAAVLAQAPKNFKGLEMSVAGVERAPTAKLLDCPPSTNTVTAQSRGAEEFVVVTVKFKVLPEFKPMQLKRPTGIDTSGKTFISPISFVDVGKTPEFSCTIPFRVPTGVKLKSVQVESVSLDVPQ